MWVQNKLIWVQHNLIFVEKMALSEAVFSSPAKQYKMDRERVYRCVYVGNNFVMEALRCIYCARLLSREEISNAALLACSSKGKGCLHW